MRAPDETSLRLFWHWVNERHNIYLKRKAGQPKPWTTDEVLRHFKFTNVFRQLDTGTVWLSEHWLNKKWRTKNIDTSRGYNAYWSRLLFNICLYRHVNWWETAERLGYTEEWEPESFVSRINGWLAEGLHVWTGAHIIRGRDGMSKAESVAITLSDLWEQKEDMLKLALSTKSLQAVFEMLLKVEYIGEFLAYEFVSDMRWTPILSDATDIMTWANAGPGAQRGLRRLWPDIKPGERLPAMRWLLEQSRVKGRLSGSDYIGTADWVPDLEMREIEHSLCEFDKYVRTLRGEGRPRSTYPG